MGATFGAVIPVTGLNIGFPGQPSRTGEKVVVARQADPANAHNISFGQAVVILSSASTPAASASGATPGTYQSVADFIAAGGTFTAAKFAGIAIREVKTNLLYTTLVQPNTTSQLGYYAPGEECEVLERGSIVVTLQIAAAVTIASQGTVYIRVAANGAYPSAVVGGIEGVADGANTVALSNVVFRTGVLDANNSVEITLLNRVAA
jgi:hypothetical protein